MLGEIADRMTQGVEGIGNAVSGAFFEPVIRLGVTGLSRAGKTVFITSLVANLLDRGRMPQLIAASSGAIRTAYLQPQPDDTIPRFDYETHLAALTGPSPHWPESTRAVSELRLSLRVQPTGLIGAMSGPRPVHIDIVDYPGEWLLDLALLDKSYADWSSETLTKAEKRSFGATLTQALEGADPKAKFDEPTAQSIAKSFKTYLGAARDAGFSDCSLNHEPPAHCHQQKAFLLLSFVMFSFSL